MTGRWLGASLLLGRDVPVDEPYPHICRFQITGTMTGRQVWIGRRDCAACAQITPTAAAQARNPR